MYALALVPIGWLAAVWVVVSCLSDDSLEEW